MPPPGGHLALKNHLPKAETLVTFVNRDWCYQPRPGSGNVSSRYGSTKRLPPDSENAKRFRFLLVGRLSNWKRTAKAR